MVLFGTGGQMIDMIDSVKKQFSDGQIACYDTFSKDVDLSKFGELKWLNTVDKLKAFFKKDPRFIPAVGSSKLRETMVTEGRQLGGQLISVFDKSAVISDTAVNIGEGVNIMAQSFVSSDVVVGEGTLVNVGCHLHHEVRVGKYVILSPRVVLLGKVSIGAHSFVGTGAIIYPGIVVGAGCKIGAGAVITKDVGDGERVLGPRPQESQ